MNQLAQDLMCGRHDKNTYTFYLNLLYLITKIGKAILGSNTKIRMRCQIMNTKGLLVSAFLFTLPFSAFAGWQVTTPESSMPREPFFQAGTQQQAPTYVPSSYGSEAFPNQYANLGQPAAVYAVSISGSLKENIERIMSRYHWRVVWKAPYDYNFDGKVTGSSLPNVMEKLLQPFPLQAVMYMSNRTLAIVPRAKV